MKPIKKHIEEVSNNGIKILLKKFFNLFKECLNFYKKFIFLIKLGLIFAFYEKRNDKIPVKKKILLGCIVWGESYIRKLTEVSFPSYFSKNNIPKLIKEGYEIELIIITEPNDNYKQIFLDILENLLIKNKLSLKDLKIEFIFKEQMNYDNLSSYMICHFEESIKRDSIWFWLCPDILITDGSVTNLVSMIDSNDCCVGTPVFRVKRSEFLREFKNKDNTKENILMLSFKHFFSDIVNSFKTKQSNINNNVSWTTGISIEKSNIGYLATNTLPAVWCAKIIKSDIQYYKKYRANIHDHLWPSKLLIERRLRVVSSSDLCFAVELTEENSIKYPKLNRLGYWHKLRDYPLRYNFENRRNIHSVVMGSFNYHINYDKN
ncbi:MAG: hypothetical protein CMI90_06005 [Pelagibacteraceae bacterium]|nr:hypothetical protein [Pelagibacteraceae bacterium]|tara:strand:+ start:290 stop:1417 length:1128 start_codon:yes stop_codon:yes gene_type:complete